MRIVYLAASAIPSAENANSIQVMSMCEAIAQSGHEVQLIAPARPGRLRGIDPFDYYGVARIFRIEWLPWLPFKGRGYLYAWMAARRAAQLAPDLVYGRLIAGCYLTARRGLATVLEVHQPVRTSEPFLRWMMSRIADAPGLRRVVAVSRSLAEQLARKHGIPAAKMIVAPNAAREPRLPAAEPRFEAGRMHAGYIGGLLPGKGIELIIQLAPTTPWVTYHVVGGTFDEVQGWQKEVREPGRVVFHGRVAPAETDALRQSFDVLLAPYHRHSSDPMEGVHPPWLSPLKLMEYMAAGKPILCSDLPAYREILENERTALLCDPDDPKSWRRALTRLRDDPELRNGLGEAARAVFLEGGTWKHRVQQVLEGLK